MRRLEHRRSRKIANTVIADPERHTVIDDETGVRSIQAANLTMPEEELARVWSPMHLERLARTYWRYLSRVCLGLIRVHYSETERQVVFITRPFVLLRFHAPEYEVSASRGIVRWRIKDGLLVDQRGRHGDGYLEIDVRRDDTDEPGMAIVRVEVEVANFYPSLWYGIAKWFYANTQSRIHVIVTHGFLKSLARLDFQESRVGRFARWGVGTGRPPGSLLDQIEQAGEGNGAAPRPQPPPVDVTEGDTPWPAWAVLVAAALALAGAFLLSRRD